MASKQKQAPLTHFLCLPLATKISTPHLARSLQRFAQETGSRAARVASPPPNWRHPLRSDPSDSNDNQTRQARQPATASQAPSWNAIPNEAAGAAGTDSSLVQGRGASGSSFVLPARAIRPAGTLHLTLGVMSLTDRARIDAAMRLLRDGLDLSSLTRHSATPTPPATSAAKDSSRKHGSVDDGDSNDGPTSDAKQEEISATINSEYVKRSSSHGKDVAAATTSSSADLSASPADPLPKEDPTTGPWTPLPPARPQPSLLHSRSNSLVVSLKGLHAMHSPQKTSILYAEPVDETDRLYQFCEAVAAQFTRAGLIRKENRDLKLHATIVNTVYGSGRSGGARRGRGRGGHSKGGPPQFDARDLILQWKDTVWAEVEIEKLAICEMGAKEDENGDVHYVEIAEKSLLFDEAGPKAG